MKQWIRTPYQMGVAIADGRKARGLTQEELAARAGVSRSWLAKVETGKASFDFRKVLAVLAPLGMVLTVEVPDE